MTWSCRVEKLRELSPLLDYIQTAEFRTSLHRWQAMTPLTAASKSYSSKEP